MFAELIKKELRSIIQSPKFVATFLVCSVLIILSIFIGVQEYRASRAQYQALEELVDQRQREAGSWGALSDLAIREPQPLQIFVSGLSYDIGRWSRIGSQEPVKLQGSNYSEDPVFAVFRFIDFAFIVQVVLSLLAILFTYDAISGEKERGTLRLVMANQLPRSKYILAKFAGSWLGLVIPVMISILIGILIVMLFNVHLSGSDWIKVMGLIGISILFFTFYIMLGVFISTLTKRSSISFLVALVIWVATVLIIPRAGVLAAGQLKPVASIGEIEGQLDAYTQNRWNKFFKEAEERWQERGKLNLESENPEDEEKLWRIMKIEDEERKKVEKDIEEYRAKVFRDVRKRKAAQERLAFTLTRFSPASSYQLAAMNLAATDLGMKQRYLESMDDYRSRFNDLVAKKDEEEGGMGGQFVISMSSEEGFSIKSGRDGGELDLSELPEYEQPARSLAEVLKKSITDFSLLFVYTMLALTGAYSFFMRYDLR